MKMQEIIAVASVGLEVATAAAQLYARAIAAANDGDAAGAADYLRQARTRAADASADWHAAPGPAIGTGGGTAG